MMNASLAYNTTVHDVGSPGKTDSSIRIPVEIDFIKGFGSALDDKDRMATPPSDTTVEDALSKGLLKLSIKERNAMEEEIHGVRCMGVSEETPDLLQRSLEEFNREILMLKNSHSRLAILQNTNRMHADVLRNIMDTNIQDNSQLSPTMIQKQCYLNDPNIRLRFLRCEHFGAQAAAKRMLNFLELAAEVFGDYVAERPIRMMDFFDPKNERRSKRTQQREKKALSNSRVQYLPFRDRSGRRVKVGVGDINTEYDLKLRLKINLLLDWIASEDVETQQKGVVNIVWVSEPETLATCDRSTRDSSASSKSSSVSDNSGWEAMRLKYTTQKVSYLKKYLEGQPIRNVSVHWCSQDNHIYRVLNSIFYFAMDAKNQSRFKVHYGEPLEIRYKLQAFGIPIDLLPLTHTMALKKQNHTQWIACRRHIEEQREQKRQQQSCNPYLYQTPKIEQLPGHQTLLHQQILKQPWDDERAVKFFEMDNTTKCDNSLNGHPVAVECPRSYDVIIGKAKVCTNNPGNGFYASLIEAMHDEHDALSNAREKVSMTWKILLHITVERGGRFLDFNKSLNAYVVIQDRVTIRKKIANSFKEYKRSRFMKNSPRSNLKKKLDEANSSSNARDDSNRTIGSSNTTSSVMSKRRKISGCLGDINGCLGELSDSSSQDGDVQSMFANL